MDVFVAFVLLVILTVTTGDQWDLCWGRSWNDWLLDLIGLFVQGILIPFLQVTVIYYLYLWLFPSWKSGLILPPLVAFGISFILVDYLYYWNHRLFHTKLFWKIHIVHHTLTEMLVFGTSRNTVWTSFFILYLWVHGFFLYVLVDKNAYLIGVSLTSMLDLWRHSGLSVPSWLAKWIGSWLILPHDHAWHHANCVDQGNYGANFKLWDLIHNTYYSSDGLPSELGVKTQMSLGQKLFYPNTDY